MYITKTYRRLHRMTDEVIRKEIRMVSFGIYRRSISSRKKLDCRESQNIKKDENFILK